MGWSARLCGGALAVVVAATPVWAADTVQAQIDAARAAYQKNDLPRTAQALEAAMAEVLDRLGKALAETMPPATGGWQAEAPEIQGLGQVGGGVAVTRAYGKGESSLNVSLFLDSSAVADAAAQLANPDAAAGLNNTRRVKVGNEDAVLRFDAANASGEVTMVLGTRVLLSVEGDNIASGDILVEAAKGWNLARIRQIVGP